ncbi:MAG: rhombosortase [Burkholderiales bacterium RIFCSPLOWO2_02_FULL_57_36]|nr:MAG: rhombosortase [Burkholderiales bacterium RIFCSPLOWO2_02_FULL_57_36]
MQLPEARHSKWLLCLGVSFCALVLMVWPNALIDFRYDRTGLESGQWWRIATGHVVHLNVAHLLLNLFGLFLVCEVLWRGLPWPHGCALLFFSATGTSALLWWLHPELAWYAGLSSVVHGLWAGCALAGWWSMQTRDAASAATDGMIQMRWASSRYFFMGALTLLALKLGLEAVYGPSPHTERIIEGQVISMSHLYGALTGLVYVSIWRGVAGLPSRK